MKWEIHSAKIIGSEHERTKRNRQDFCGFFLPRQSDQNRYGGVICDGCSAGDYSEVGAALLGNLVLNLIKKGDITKPDAFGVYCEKNITRFIQKLTSLLKYNNKTDIVYFIHQFLLSTFIFAVIDEEIIVIGRSGDGVIIVNDEVTIIDQQGKPNYIAYREIPLDFFEGFSCPVDDFSIQSYSVSSVDKVVIASDGIIPILKTEKYKEIFGTSKRQLQRKFNVWQQKEKVFFDDVSCIVFEKRENDNKGREEGVRI